MMNKPKTHFHDQNNVLYRLNIRDHNKLCYSPRDYSRPKKTDRTPWDCRRPKRFWETLGDCRKPKKTERLQDIVEDQKIFWETPRDFERLLFRGFKDCERPKTFLMILQKILRDSEK